MGVCECLQAEAERSAVELLGRNPTHPYNDPLPLLTPPPSLPFGSQSCWDNADKRRGYKGEGVRESEKKDWRRGRKLKDVVMNEED